MNPNISTEEPAPSNVEAPSGAEPPASTVPSFSGTPWSWRLSIAAAIALLGFAAYLMRDLIGVQGQAAVGIVFFFGLVAAFSANLRAVNWRTIAWGFGLQVVLAVLVLKTDAVYQAFETIG